jgi:hypothetical protein
VRRRDACEAVHSFESERLREAQRARSLESMKHLVASLLAVTLVALAPAAFADDPIREIVDREVPALKNGSRIPLVEIEKAILDACARRNFKATVDSTGMITARWQHRKHSFEITIPYTNRVYSIRYKNSERMDYDQARGRIDDAYNEYVDGLSEHIEADLDRALERLKKSQKSIRKVARINPRYSA